MMERGEHMRLDGGYEDDGGIGEDNIEYVRLVAMESTTVFKPTK